MKKKNTLSCVIKTHLFYILAWGSCNQQQISILLLKQCWGKVVFSKEVFIKNSGHSTLSEHCTEIWQSQIDNKHVRLRRSWKCVNLRWCCKKISVCKGRFLFFKMVVPNFSELNFIFWHGSLGVERARILFYW